MTYTETLTGAWGRYQAKIGYLSMKRDEEEFRVLAAFDYQAPSDNAADSFARRLADVLCGSSGWGPHYEVTRIEPAHVG